MDASGDASCRRRDHTRCLGEDGNNIAETLRLSLCRVSTNTSRGEASRAAHGMAPRDE